MSGFGGEERRRMGGFGGKGTFEEVGGRVGVFGLGGGTLAWNTELPKHPTQAVPVLWSA